MHNVVATRGQYLALRKASLSCFACFSLFVHFLQKLVLFVCISRLSES